MSTTFDPAADRPAPAAPDPAGQVAGEELSTCSARSSSVDPATAGTGGDAGTRRKGVGGWATVPPESAGGVVVAGGSSWAPVPCGTDGRRWVGPVLDPATAATVAERAARLAGELAASGFPRGQVERLRNLVGPVPSASGAASAPDVCA